MAVGRRARASQLDHEVVADLPRDREVGADLPEEPALDTWELDGPQDSWEPIVPERWSLPAEAEPEDDTDSAGWSDAARSAQEWVDAAHHDGDGGTPAGVGAALPPGVLPGYGTRPDETRPDETRTAGTRTAGTRADEEQGPDAESELTRAEWAESHVPAPEPPPNPARMALGLASMAAQRLRGDVPVGDGFMTGVGLAQETANGLMQVGRRVLGPAAAVVRGTLRGASFLPVVGIPLRVARRTRERLATALADARTRGEHTVEAGRVEAERLLRRLTRPGDGAHREGS